MSGRFTNGAFAAAVTLALAACQQAPQLGAHVSAPPPTGPKIEITSASVDVARHVVVTVQIARDGEPLGLDAARALAPAWTLAALSPDPVNPGTALPAWRSLVLTGAETLENLPVAGPGTPAEQVLVKTRQPGAESAGTWSEQGSGAFTYTFATSLPEGQSLSETLRVGVFLTGVPGTALTTSTHDFVPDHSPLMGRELVVDEACAGCHSLLRAHGASRTGTKICVTCHPYQHADGQTVDPAAAASALPTTNPNPLEMGRLVHRIHRGKSLPTLYVASTASDGTLDPAPQPYAEVEPRAPFRAGANKLPTDATWIGRRFAVIGELSRERVYGKITSRDDNGQPAKIVASGVTFPRDYRSCDACHTNDAAQVAAIDTEISRRTCHGCHPDVWFEGAVAPATEALPLDVFHLAHPGGPQPDDSRCKECHVPTAANPDVRVPIKDAHVPPYRHARYSKPVVEIVSVTNLKPGLAPTIVFKVSDRNGPIRDLVNPSPSEDGNVPASNVPRALSRLTISLAGPAAPDIRNLGTATLPLSESLIGNATRPPPTSDAEGRFTFTFPDTKPIPSGMDGTWIVVIEARRSNQPSGGTAPFWDANAKRVVWPYTGETVTEIPDNAVAWVDTATGELGSGAPSLRRTIVDLKKCNACHQRLTFHGGRNQVEWCAACHSPDKTDWSRRAANAKDLAGNVNLAATYDGIEERSVHFKVLVHRLHTGGRAGPAELSAITPFTIYGYSGPTFHDDGAFPNDLQRCTACHLEGTYRVESVPADAAPTIANETGTIRHLATTAHSPDEPATPPVSAACLGCHGTASTAFHAARYTSDGKESCVSCHGVKGAQSVDKVHALPIPVVPTP
jgi:OmcA/MtrC family decaheme c-type cytochrome